MAQNLEPAWVHGRWEHQGSLISVEDDTQYREVGSHEDTEVSMQSSASLVTLSFIVRSPRRDDVGAPTRLIGEFAVRRHAIRMMLRACAMHPNQKKSTSMMGGKSDSPFEQTLRSASKHSHAVCAYLMIVK